MKKINNIKGHLIPLKYMMAMALGAFLYSQYNKSDVSFRVNSELQEIKAGIMQVVPGANIEEMQNPADKIITHKVPEEENSIEAIVAREVKKFNADDGYKHKLTKNLMLAIIGQESKFNSYAVSKAGAKGLMQLMPITERDCNINGIKINDAFNPEENIGCGTHYFGRLLNRYGGDVKLALAAYNAGPSNVNGKIPDFSETQHYVKRVMAKFAPYVKEMPKNKTPKRVAKVERKLSLGKQPIEHSVKEGENLYRICQKYGVWNKCDKIAIDNGIKNMDEVKPGDVITIAYNR